MNIGGPVRSGGRPLHSICDSVWFRVVGCVIVDVLVKAAEIGFAVDTTTEGRGWLLYVKKFCRAMDRVGEGW